jgi:hypothetical protein
MRMFSLRSKSQHDECNSNQRNHINDPADPPQAMPANWCWQKTIIVNLCPSTL